MKSSNNAEELASYLKSKNLDSISLILLDVLMPLERTFAYAATFSIPFLELLLGTKTAESIENFLRNETPLQELKNALEKGTK